MKINGMANGVKGFVVVRMIDGDAWFWGVWDDEDAANNTALEIGGEVVRVGI